MNPPVHELSPDTVLRRTRNLRLRIDSDEIVYVVKHGSVISCGPRGLAILDVFSKPTTFAEALDALGLQIQGAEDWMEITNMIVSLYRTGVLRERSEDDDARPAADGSFADPMTHAMMLNDRARTSSFIAAIRAVVKPGDVVLDIGTGTGVLAIAAAQAGAERVYAIEASGIARVARAIIEANGLADRITLLEGWSTHLTLPDRADVLVSEIIGEMPLEEHVLEVTLDALQRLLKPHALVIPNRLRIFGLPVAIPPDRLETRTVTDSAIENWRSWYGIEFGPMVDASRDLAHMVYLDRETAAELPPMSPPAKLADLDLTGFQQLQVDTVTTLSATSADLLNGVLMYFETDLGGGAALSTHPAKADQSSSWRNAVWFFNNPIPLQAGDRFSVAFTYRVPGTRNGARIARA